MRRSTLVDLCDGAVLNSIKRTNTVPAMKKTSSSLIPLETESALDVGKRTLLWTYPVVFCILCSICIGVVYSLIPVTNVYVVMFVRLIYWDIFGCTAVVELIALSLPGLRDNIYCISYLIGFLTVPFVQYIIFYQNMGNNAFWSTFAIISDTIVPFVLAMGCVTFNYFDGEVSSPVKGSMASSVSLQEEGVVHRGESRVASSSSIDKVKCPVDAFALSTTEAEIAGLIETKRRYMINNNNNNKTHSNNREKASEAASSSCRTSKGWTAWIVWHDHRRTKSRVLSRAMSNVDDVLGHATLKPNGTDGIICGTRSLEAAAVPPSSCRRWFWFLPRFVLQHNYGLNEGELRLDGFEELMTLDDGITESESAKSTSNDITTDGKDNTFLKDKLLNNGSGHSNGSMNDNSRKVMLQQRVRWRQIVYLVFFFIVFNGYYFCLVLFSKFFRNEVGGAGKVLYFLGFFSTGNILRPLTKRCGLKLDEGKSGNISMYFVGEVMTLSFYYSFYRALFEAVDSWLVFCAVQTIHLTSEWLTYPLRTSQFLFKVNQYVESSFPSLNGVLRMSEMDQKDWVAFTALDFGIRCVVLITSSLGVSILLLIYNHFDYIGNYSALQQDSKTEKRTFIYLIISIALELLNASVMNRAYFCAVWDVNVHDKVWSCFSNQRFAILSTILCSLSFIAVDFAFTDSAVQ